MLSRAVQIPSDADGGFRSFLLGASPEPVRKILSQALVSGPMQSGAERSASYFGMELQDVLLQTVAVIDEIEWFRPGFKKWLDATGFGNDYRMIKAFAKWSEMENRGELRSGLFERTRH